MIADHINHIYETTLPVEPSNDADIIWQMLRREAQSKRLYVSHTELVMLYPDLDIGLTSHDMFILRREQPNGRIHTVMFRVLEAFGRFVRFENTNELVYPIQKMYLTDDIGLNNPF